MDTQLALNDIRFRFSVAASPAVAFGLWSSEAGIRSFFAPQCHTEPAVGGAFEIYFDPDAPPGSRGSEGCRYLSLIPDEMIAFSWNSPPSLERLRGQRTLVRILFLPEQDSTGIVFDHLGMGLGDDWQKNRQYFTRAWGDIVLPRFKSVAEGAVVDWDHPAQLPGITPL